jgi:hypothetical protein
MAAMKRLFAVLAVLAATLAGAVVAGLPARAASPGSGFGSWGPWTPYGWHGSMMVGDLHTYCILPGRALPTGASEDRGISADAAGLNAQQLTAVNMLVSTYGQTSDPVEAAAVGWAVKAIANWDETLHHFGYGGDRLEGAIDWVFSRIAPEHSAAVQQRAAALYAEGMGVAAAPPAASGSLVFAVDPLDPLAGTMTVAADVPGASGEVRLTGAVFSDTGADVRGDVTAGSVYPIRAILPDGATAVSVSGTGMLRGGFRAAVHHFTTPGGQDTAGPAGAVEIPVAGADQAPRETTFAPVVTTQVAARYAAQGGYVDDVAFASARGSWARTPDGGYLPVTATATVFRTDSEPPASTTVPADAEPVGSLTVTTDAAAGPTVPYRVASDWMLPGPGFFTAVWRIDADAQSAATREALDAGYSWVEAFGEPSQVMVMPAVTSAADPVAAVGGPMSDLVIAAAAVPSGGLDLSAAVYRVPDGSAPADACVDANLVWSGHDAPTRVTGPGSAVVTAPAVPDFGVYVWVERAVDAQGRLVHMGVCGMEHETTRAPLPTVTTTAPESAEVGGMMSDRAAISGPVPVIGATELTFQVFRAPDGIPPEQACTPETMVADTTAAPVPVAAAGEYVSPAVPVTGAGIHYWIEQLWFTPPDGQRRLLSQGACGAPGETTRVAAPAIVTSAVERAATGEPYHDTATVTGLAAGADADLVFSVFHAEPGEPPVCTDATRETVTEPLPVTGAGDYRSASVVSTRPGVKLWVAQLRYRPVPSAEPVVLATGECGAAGETTHVDLLATTGAGWMLPLVGTGGAAAVLAGSLAVARARPSRTRFGGIGRAR